MLPNQFRALIVLFGTSALYIVLHITNNERPSEDGQHTYTAMNVAISTIDDLVGDRRPGPLHRITDQRREPFVLNTSKCYVPDFDPHDPAMAKYFTKRVTTCPLEQPRFLFRTEVRGNRTCPVIDVDALTSYSPPVEVASLNCQYYVVKRKEDAKRPDTKYRLSNARDLKKDSCPGEEHIWLSCEDDSRRKFEQPLLLPRVREARTAAKANGTANVLVLGIDALSRLNFLRQMKRTRRWLETRPGVVEMFGYNKIGENSAPNQIPMLTGVSYSPDGLMDRAIGNYFDNLTEYIWDYYKGHGFSTMFFEEQWSTGLFVHPSMEGFQRIPTDYYPRPLMQMIDRIKKDEGNLCLDGHYAERLYLRYLVDALELARHSQPLFAYAWFSELSHDFLNGAKRADDDFIEFFELLERKGLLEETVILFLSDHGSRLEEWRGTTVGRYEDMMPYFYAMLPPKLIEARPDAVSRLVVNSRRLITVYDIYATLRELAVPHWTADQRDRGQGLSLISHEIPENRSCTDAGINLQFCSCLRPARINQNSQLVQDFADFVIRTANKEIERNKATPLCRTWSFKGVIDVFRLEDPDKQFEIYKILLAASPDNAQFEASAKLIDGKFKLLSRIERLDWYSSHAGCVQGRDYARYCYCRQ